MFKIITALLVLVGLFFGLFNSILAQGTSPMWDYPIDLTQASSSTNAIDPIILCDQYQNTHILWGDRDEMPALYYMNDVSGDWSAPLDVIANRNNSSLILRLSGTIQSNPDVLHVLWVDEYISAVLNYSHVDLSEAGDPRAWMDPIPIAVGVENGSIDVDQEGNLHIVYGVPSTDYSEVMINYIYSTDNGINWSSPNEIFMKKVAVPSDPIALIDIDDKDRIHVGISIRSQDYGKYSEVGYIRSMDGGSNWSEYRLIDNMGTAFQGVNLITPYAFENDKIHLTWHDPRRMHQWSSDGGLTWSDPVEIMPLGAAFGGSNALTKDSQGTIYVVTAENGGVFSAKWEGSRWGIPERIEDRPFDPHAQNIAICQGNKLQIIYDDRSDSQNIWYSYRFVDAPHLQQVSFKNSSHSQTPVSQVGAEIETPEGMTSESANPEQLNMVGQENLSANNQVPSRPMLPILLAASVVMGLILVVILIRRKSL